MSAGRRFVLVCLLAVTAAIGALMAMVAAAEVSRPAPKRCRDTFVVEVNSAAACAAPEANPIVVIAAGGVAALAVAAAVVVWSVVSRRRGARTLEV